MPPVHPRTSWSLVPPGWTRRRFALGVCAAFALPALVFISQVYYSTLAEGGRAPVWRAVSVQTGLWLIWAALSPLVVWIIHRSEMMTRRLMPRLLLLTAGGVFCAAVQSAGMFTIYSLAGQNIPGNRAPTLGSFFQGWLVINFILYAAIICAVFAILYYNRFREREVAASELAVQLSQAQLRALRMQLNPHFLFNALNTIAMLVRKEDGHAAVRMLAGLSDLLRYALDDDAADEVPLAGELAFLDRYLAIERTRFGDRLRVTVDVDAHVLDALVPNLILQPLVENAVRYGVAPRAAGGAICISASRTGSELVLAVSDDGPGLADEASMSAGVGLTNTRERLARLYGVTGTLAIANASAGVVVRITIPYHTAPLVTRLAS